MASQRVGYAAPRRFSPKLLSFHLMGKDGYRRQTEPVCKVERTWVVNLCITNLVFAVLFNTGISCGNCLLTSAVEGPVTINNSSRKAFM